MIWNNIKNKKPIAYKKGDWDGLKSDKILVCTKDEVYYVAVVYEGILDGNEFFQFYDENRDFEINNVELWAEISNPKENTTEKNAIKQKGIQWK